MTDTTERRSMTEALRLIHERARAYRRETGREIAEVQTFGRIMGEVIGLTDTPEVNAAYARTWFEQWRLEHGAAACDPDRA